MTHFINRHPKEQLPPVGRRAFLGGSLAALGVAGSGLLTACGDDGGSGSGGTPTELPLASPDNPVTLPISEGNQPIADGQAPESGGVFKILNYADYMAPGVMKKFGEEQGVEVEVTPITNYDELLAKLRQPGADFDLVVGGPSIMSKLVFAELIQPFNKTYLPNIANLWEGYQSPYYDVGAQFSVPYTVYTSGIGYRADRVSSVPANGWDLVWDPAYAGKTYVLDDARESLAMSMLRNGITEDINTEDPADLQEASDALTEAVNTVNLKVGIQAYVFVPEGTATVHHTWSGDMVGAQWYLPKGTPVEALGYWKQEGAPIGNDCLLVGKNATKPVLAHMFINDLLDNEISLKNFAWNGYQPPITALDIDKLVSDGYVPENLSTAIVRPEDFESGLVFLELSPAGDAAWQTAWGSFKAGA